MKKKYGTKLKVELINDLKKLSDDTRIPAARLLEEAIEDLLKKHKKEGK